MFRQRLFWVLSISKRVPFFVASLQDMVRKGKTILYLISNRVPGSYKPLVIKMGYLVVKIRVLGLRGKWITVGTHRVVHVHTGCHLLKSVKKWGFIRKTISVGVVRIDLLRTV